MSWDPGLTKSKDEPFGFRLMSLTSTHRSATLNFLASPIPSYSAIAYGDLRNIFRVFLCSEDEAEEVLSQFTTLPCQNVWLNAMYRLRLVQHILTGFRKVPSFRHRNVQNPAECQISGYLPDIIARSNVRNCQAICSKDTSLVCSLEFFTITEFMTRHVSSYRHGIT